MQTQKAIAEICNDRLRSIISRRLIPGDILKKLKQDWTFRTAKHQGVERTNYNGIRVEKLERIQKEISKLEV